MISIAVQRPDATHVGQYFCADRGYDYDDVHQFVEQQRYIVDIKHRLRKVEPKIEVCPIPGETQFPARR